MGGRKQINYFVIKAALKETINPYSEVNSAINEILIGLRKGCIGIAFFYFKNRLTWHERGPLYLAWEPLPESQYLMIL